MCKVSSKDQSILEPALLLPPHLSQPPATSLSSDSAASLQPSTSSDDATSRRQRLQAGASQGADSSSLGPGTMSTDPVIAADVRPAGAPQDLPEEAVPKPKRRLKRSRSSPILAGQQLEHLQHDKGENEGIVTMLLAMLWKEGSVFRVLWCKQPIMHHRYLRCFAIVRLPCCFLVFWLLFATCGSPCNTDIWRAY